MNANTDNESIESDSITKTGYLRNDDDQQGRPAERKFGARTILVPVLFVLLHLVVVNLTAAAFIVVDYISSAAGSGALPDPGYMMNTDYLNEIISRYTPQIALAYSLILLPVYLIYLRLSARNNPDAIWLRRVTTSDLLPSLAMITGAMGLTNLYFLFLDWLSGKSSIIEKLMNDYLELTGSLSTDTNYLWLAIGIGIAAPAVEELLFRGIIQGELRRAMPEWIAIIIQAVLFSAFHMQPVQSSYVMIPGLLLGMAYAWSKSLWIPIAMHILFNLLGSLIPSLVQSNEALGGAVAVTEIIFIPIGIVAGVYFFRKRQKTGRQLINVQ